MTVTHAPSRTSKGQGGMDEKESHLNFRVFFFSKFGNFFKKVDDLIPNIKFLKKYLTVCRRREPSLVGNETSVKKRCGVRTDEL